MQITVSLRGLASLVSQLLWSLFATSLRRQSSSVLLVFPRRSRTLGVLIYNLLLFRWLVFQTTTLGDLGRCVTLSVFLPDMIEVNGLPRWWPYTQYLCDVPVALDVRQGFGKVSNRSKVFWCMSMRENASAFFASLAVS